MPQDAMTVSARMVLSLALLAGPMISGCLGGLGDEEAEEPGKEPLEWEPAGEWTEVFRRPMNEASPCRPVMATSDGLVCAVTTCCEDGIDSRISLSKYNGLGFYPFKEVHRSNISVAAAAAIDDNVYLISPGPKYDSPNRFRRYNLQHRTMYEEPYPDMRGDESFHLSSEGSTVLHDGVIYIVGGCCGPPRIWAWDPDVGEMWKVTDIPLPDGDDQHIEGFEPVLDGSDILIWYDNGSYHEGNEKYYALRYNLTTDNWSPPRQLPQWPTELIAHEGEIWQFYRYCLFEWQPDGTYQAGVGPPPYHNLWGPVQWNGEIYLQTRVSTPSWVVDAEDQSVLYQWTPPDPEAWPPPPPSEEGSEQAERRASCERLVQIEDSEQGTS